MSEHGSAANWKVFQGKNGVAFIMGADERLLLASWWWLGVDTSKANALTERVVACVNACAPQTNEELTRGGNNAEIDRMRAENAAMWRLLYDIVQTGPYDLSRLEDEFRWQMEAVREYVEQHR